MNKYSFFIFLLVFSLLFTSCSNSGKLFLKEKYSETVEYVDKQKEPSKEDYYYKSLALYKSDRLQEARSSILKYLLLADEKDDRAFLSDLFLQLGYSDAITITALKPTDSLKAAICIYESYSNLGMFEDAQTVLEKYLKGRMSNRDISVLLVNYPIFPEYIADSLNTWFDSIYQDEKSDFLVLIERFASMVRQTEKSLNTLNLILEKAKNDNYYKSNSDFILRINLLSESINTDK